MALEDVYVKHHGGSVIDDWNRVLRFHLRASRSGAIVTAEPLEYDSKGGTITYRRICNLVPMLLACREKEGLADHIGRLIGEWRAFDVGNSSTVDADAADWLVANGLDLVVAQKLLAVPGEIHPDFWHGNMFWSRGQLVILDPIPALPIFKKSPSLSLGCLDVSMLYVSFFLCHGVRVSVLKNPIKQYGQVAEAMLSGVCGRLSVDGATLKAAAVWLGEQYVADYYQRLCPPVAWVKSKVSTRILGGLNGGG